MNTQSRGIRRFLFLTVLIVLPTCMASAEDVQPKLLAECPGGKLYQYGGQRLLLLAGSPYQMGLAHGTLLRDDVKAMVHTVLNVARAADAVQNEDFFAGTIEQAYRRIEPFIPQRYQDELRGLADGAGLAVTDVQLANVFPALFHCSGFALFGRATVGGELLHGRVLDYITQIGLQNRAVTIIARPKGYNAFVNVSYAGFIGTVTGMNEKQIGLGELGGGGVGLWDGLSMPLLCRKVLEEADTLQQAVDIFRKTPRTCQYFYVLSDGKISDARGLYCTPDTVVALKAGQRYEDLPEAATEDKALPRPIDDAIVFSGGDRLTHLLRRVSEQYGRIDPAAAIDLMTRPVAMKGNLHNALFAPASLEMWVSHAAGDVTAPRYQACFQEYQRYDLRQLMALLPTDGDSRSDAAPVETARVVESQPARQTGRTPATVFRPLAPDADPRLAEQVKLFEEDRVGFDWRMKLLRNSGSLVVHTVEFPSPYVSPVERNNTVHCEYFLAGGGQRRPAVIVLHILDGSFTVARIICQRLASEGVNALLVKMPYYGPRRPADKARLRRMTDDPAILVDGVTQAVKDVRRAARWLASREEVDPDQIGLCGVSLGGFVAATAAGVDGTFPRVAIVLAGGDLTTMITGLAKEVQALRQAIEKRNWTPAKLKELLAPIEPLTYASRLRGSNVIMLNASKDEVVPPSCTERLVQASGARVTWYPADHYSMAWFLPAALEALVEHFSPADAPATGSDRPGDE